MLGGAWNARCSGEPKLPLSLCKRRPLRSRDALLALAPFDEGLELFVGAGADRRRRLVGEELFPDRVGAPGRRQAAGFLLGGCNQGLELLL